MHKLYFLIGASGAGKTTMVKALEKEGSSLVIICYFDSIGVPSIKEMIKDFGSPEEWQRVKTKEWVRRIKEELLPKANVILDAQTRPVFIEEACKENSVSDAEIILIDCAEKIRKKRLERRGQPELADERMMSWAKFLREECLSRGCTIIDNSDMTPEETLRSFKEHLSLLDHHKEARNDFRKA